jgi:hypothetical protein
MAPTHDYVATIEGMTVVAEITAFKFKLNSNPLPFPWPNLSFRFTVRIARLNSFNRVAQFPGYYSE